MQIRRAPASQDKSRPWPSVVRSTPGKMLPDIGNLRMELVPYWRKNRVSITEPHLAQGSADVSVAVG